MQHFLYAMYVNFMSNNVEEDIFCMQLNNFYFSFIFIFIIFKTILQVFLETEIYLTIDLLDWFWRDVATLLEPRSSAKY